jgi:hypothetical protein
MSFSAAFHPIPASSELPGGGAAWLNWNGREREWLQTAALAGDGGRRKEENHLRWARAGLVLGWIESFRDETVTAEKTEGLD